MGRNERNKQQTSLLSEETPGKEEEDVGSGEGALKQVHLEDVLAESVGEWGWFQVWIGAIFFFCQATMAPGVYAAVFTDYTPKHYCVNTSEEFNMTVWDSLETKENRCGGEGCREWTFDRSVMESTASSEFNIVCDQAFLKPLANTFRMSGLLIGSFFFGWLSD